MSQKDSLRLDRQIHLRYPSLSRSTIQKLIKSGQVFVNGVVELHSSRPTSDDERLEVQIQQLEYETNEHEFNIVYEDNDCVVIDKPQGVLVHSKGAFNPEPTVASWLKTRPGFDFPLDNDRGGIVHRLDRATSGVMICAKNKSTLGLLQKQFQNRTVKKTYIALVKGIPKLQKAMIDLPIGRNPKKPQTFKVMANGKSAQTEYEIIKQGKNKSLLRLKPHTGRTHQLRVHLNNIGHPIYGDILYGGMPDDRLMLHAESLELTLPGGKRQIFSVKPPSSWHEDLAL